MTELNRNGMGHPKWKLTKEAMHHNTNSESALNKLTLLDTCTWHDEESKAS
jgi:hypothetical protein